MAERRPKALVTAAVRGPGLVLLGELADLTIDSWLEQPTLRIYNAEQLAERVAAEGANIVVVESDRCAGPLYELPLLAVCSCRGDPTTWTSKRRPPQASRCCGPPAGTPTRWPSSAVALLFASTRGVVAARCRCPSRRDLQGRHHPLPAVPGVAARGPDRRAGRPRSSRAGPSVAPQGLGMHVIAYDPYADEATIVSTSSSSVSDVVSMHAAVTPETTGMIGAEQFAAMREGVVFLNTARAQLHDTDALVDALTSGKVFAAGLDHFVGESLPTDHPLTQMSNVVLTPHIGGATYNAEVEPHDDHRRRPLPAARRGPAAQHRQPRSAGPLMTVSWATQRTAG